MVQQSKQDIPIGKSAGQTPVLASASQSTVEPLKPVKTASELKNIEAVARQLALLQNDCSELQSAGAKIAILARNNKLFFSLEFPNHSLGFDTGTGHLLMDGVPVLKAMESDTGT